VLTLDVVDAPGVLVQPPMASMAISADAATRRIRITGSSI
jgi:hypothetical protein